MKVIVAILLFPVTAFASGIGGGGGSHVGGLPSKVQSLEIDTATINDGTATLDRANIYPQTGDAQLDISHLTGTLSFISFRDDAATGDYRLYYSSAASQYFLWSTDIDGLGTDGNIFTVNNGTDDITFNGNIGVGVAPAGGWPSTWSIVHFGGTGALASPNGNGGSYFASNLRFSGSSWKYIKSAPGNIINLDLNGDLLFYTAPLGVPGSAAALDLRLKIGNDGTISAGKSCAIGYTRIGTNYCKADSAASYSSYFPTTCGSIAAPASDAKYIVFGVDIIVDSVGAAGGLRTTTAYTYNEATCTTTHDLRQQSVYEFSSVTAGTGIANGIVEMMAPVIGGNAYVRASAANNVAYVIEGYYD